MNRCKSATNSSQYLTYVPPCLPTYIYAVSILLQRKKHTQIYKITCANASFKSALSSHALGALKEFYAERDSHADKFARLKEAAEQNAAEGKPLSMDAFTEDWNESQFWVSKFRSA